jgi:hypothetical protein
LFLSFRGWSSMYNFGFRGWAAPNVENYPFRQTLQLPSSVWICNGCATLDPLPCAHLPLDSSPLFRSTNQHHQIQLSTYCLAYVRLPKSPNYYIFTLNMASAMFAATLDNFHHSTRLIPESRSCKSSHRLIQHSLTNANQW